MGRTRNVIVDNSATFAAYPIDDARAGDVTALLGVEPTSVHERGDAMPNLERRPPASTAPTHYRSGAWLYTVDFQADADSDDQTGAAALRALLAVFRDRADAVRALRDRYEVIVWWSGDSDSSQGGFVFPADVLADVAALGCDLYGTAYLSEEESDRTGADLELADEWDDNP